MRLQPFLCLLVVAVFGAAMAGEDDPPEVKPAPKPLPPGVKVIRDIEYAKVGDISLKMDIYQPEGVHAPLPTVVYFHGGGWRRGTRNGCSAAVPLAAKGYIVASIEYRLSQQAIFPAAIEDCKGAVRFLRANAAKYFVDPKALIAMGDSAGGHLAALMGTSGGVKDLEGTTGGNLEQSSRVQAVIDYYGPIDFIAIINQGSDVKRGELGAPEVQFLGGRTLERKDLAIKASPLTYVTKDAPPFLIVHGEKDPRVPMEQPKAMLAAIKDIGGEATLHIVKDGSHGFTAAQNAALIPVLTEFLDRHFKLAEKH